MKRLIAALALIAAVALSSCTSSSTCEWAFTSTECPTDSGGGGGFGAR